MKKTQGTGSVPRLGAISLDMMNWPDAVNHPEWRHRKVLFGAEDLFTSFASYKFDVKGHGGKK